MLTGIARAEDLSFYGWTLDRYALPLEPTDECPLVVTSVGGTFEVDGDRIEWAVMGPYVGIVKNTQELWFIKLFAGNRFRVFEGGMLPPDSAFDAAPLRADGDKVPLEWRETIREAIRAVEKDYPGDWFTFDDGATRLSADEAVARVQLEEPKPKRFPAWPSRKWLRS
jgi:hypothetical protein